MWLALALHGCSEPPVAPEVPVFVRDGVVVASGDEGRPLPDGRRLIERAWAPEDVVLVGGIAHVAPRVAECARLFSVPLGDVSAHVARGGEAPDTALAFSPDGGRLAVGTWRGELLVLDGWTGEVLARRVLAESLIKRVAWSADGRTLYAAEQSPDAYVHALDPADLSTRASLRLADEVGSSSPPAADDLYGVYALPAAYGLEVLPDGGLVVAATHGWEEAGKRLNRARILELGPDLTARAAWPEEGAADVVFRSLARGHGLLAVPVGRSADGPPPELPVGGVVVLDPALRIARELRIAPLAPHFDDAFVWEALAFGPGGRVAVGLGDGRVVVEGAEAYPLGSPVLAGDVPIAAAVGQLAWPEGGPLLAVTSRTNIPWGAARPELRPPEAHPSENTLAALRVDDDGVSLAWSYRGPQILQGLTVSPDGRWVVVGAGARDVDERTDLFGALIFDLRRAGSGVEHLAAWCPTAGPVFFRQAVAPDGRVAVAEFPYASGGAIVGDHQVTVLR